MKRFLIPLFLFALAHSSVAQEVELLTHYTVDEVADVLAGFGINENLVDLSYEVDFYKVTYQTIHPNGDSVLVTGALCVPSNLDCPLPLTSYQHGTVALKTNVPSHENYESRLGLLYASSGYAVTMPDYIGLGDSPGLHLYVHAESQANAALDLIRAAHNLQDDIGFTLDDQLFLWGYSQGGHATMALHRMIELEYNDEFQVSACAPMSGPYDISGAQAEVITSDQVYPTPGYMPYVILSYQEAYGNLYESLEDIFLPEYAAIIPGLFDGQSSMGTINAQFPDVPSEMILPEVLEAFEMDPEHPLRLALEDNDVYDWAPVAPTNLYYCNQDDQVSYQNSIVAEEAMIANGSTSVEAFDGGPFDHSDCAPFAMIAGYNFFESVREVAFAPEYTIDVIPASGADNQDGQATLNVANAEAGWTYEWSNGTSGVDSGPVLPGDYTVVISDGSCSITISVNVDWSNGMTMFQHNTFKAYPNPVSDQLTLKVSSLGMVRLYDHFGRLLMEGEVDDRATWNLSGLQPGSYIIESPEGQTIPLLKN